MISAPLNYFRFFFIFFLRLDQPGIFFCLVRETASEPGGTSTVTVVPAPMTAPLPTLTGATNCVSEPMKASSPIVVRCLLVPS